MRKFRPFHCRFDSDTIERLSNGSIRIKYARLARVGIQKYFNPDGSEWNELRTPEEVFHADSMASYVGSSLTIDHPIRGGERVYVDPSNWSDFAVGHVGYDVRKDGDFLASSLIISRADAIDAVLNKNLRELSCGYMMKPVDESGEWNGQRYDAIQTEIRNNHVALLEPGRARGGRQLTMKMDSVEPIYRLDSNREIIIESREKTMPKKITIGGITYSYEADDSFTDALSQERSRYDSLKSEFETMKGKLAAAEKEVEIEKKRADSASDQKVIDKVVNDRFELIANAVKLGVKPEDANGLSAREIKLRALGDGFRVDSSDDFIDGAFNYALSKVENEPEKEIRNDAFDGFSKSILKENKCNKWAEFDELEMKFDSTRSHLVKKENN